MASSSNLDSGILVCWDNSLRLSNNLISMLFVYRFLVVKSDNFNTLSLLIIL